MYLHLWVTIVYLSCNIIMMKRVSRFYYQVRNLFIITHIIILYSLYTIIYNDILYNIHISILTYTFLIINLIIIYNIYARNFCYKIFDTLLVYIIR